MEQITKKVLKTLLAFIMCFSVMHIPNLGTLLLKALSMMKSISWSNRFQKEVQSIRKLMKL